jgi:hypothetical protein
LEYGCCLILYVNLLRKGLGIRIQDLGEAKTGLRGDLEKSDKKTKAEYY